jgi:hypothetical protein
MNLWQKFLLLFSKKEASQDNAEQNFYRQPAPRRTLFDEVFKPEEPPPPGFWKRHQPGLTKFWIATKRYVVEYFWNAIGAIVLLGVSTFSGWAIVDCKNSPPAYVDHCYVVSTAQGCSKVDGPEKYTLRAAVIGNPNYDIGKFESIEEAVAAAGKINCTIK